MTTDPRNNSFGQLRLRQLHNWRRAIEKYARFCASSNDPIERLQNWLEGDPTYTPHLLHRPHDDRISDEIVDIATRVVAEIALHRRSFKLKEASESLGKTLGRPTDRTRLEAVLADAERQLDKAGRDALDRERKTRTGRVSLFIPPLVGPQEVAQALHLTQLRKLAIWGRDVGIKEIDPIDRTPASDRTPLTSEQRLEHKDLARRYNLKTETVAGWRRKGPEFFAAKKAELEKRLLPREITDAHKEDGEHPMVTSSRIRKNEANRSRYIRNKKQKMLRTTAFVQDEAKRRGMSESTIWRELREARAIDLNSDADPNDVSHFDSGYVTLLGGLSSDIHDSADVTSRPDALSSSGTTKRVPDKGKVAPPRLSRELREQLKEWHHEKTGRRVTDHAIRKWRERGELDSKLIAMFDELPPK